MSHFNSCSYVYCFSSHMRILANLNFKYFQYKKVHCKPFYCYLADFGFFVRFKYRYSYVIVSYFKAFLSFLPVFKFCFCLCYMLPQSRYVYLHVNFSNVINCLLFLMDYLFVYKLASVQFVF